MSPRISIRLDQKSRSLSSGQQVSGEYQLEGLTADKLTGVEASLLWFSEGKGEEELGVHFFQRSVAGDGTIDLRAPRRFEATMPNSPLSYHGVILRIRWCIRIRAFLKGGREYSQDYPLILGGVPPAISAEQS